VALVLGVSLGAHATQVEVRDAGSGALVTSAVVRHAEAGPHEEDPGAWWRSVTMAIARAGERQIAAISVCGDHPGLVLLDGAGVALRPAQPWEAAQAEVARVRAALGPERWARRAGAVPDASTAITRLAWLRRTDRDTFGRIGTVLLPHDWLTYRLAGRTVTDRGGASCTGMWSPHAERWLPEVVELLAEPGELEAWAQRLPEVVGPAERVDWLDAPIYELLGLRGRPVVAPGTGRAMAVALALDLGHGRLGVALDERTTVLAAVDEPLVDPSGVVASRADATGRHLAVTTAGGGSALVEAMADLLDLTLADFGQAALRGEPTDEVVVLPGGPGRPGAVITGVGGVAGRDELARATFEGVASAALDAVDAVVDAGARWFDHEPLHLTGPLDGLEVQAQVLATLAGRPVLATPGALAAAGACVQAAAVLEEVTPEEVAAAWGLGEGVEVDPEDDPEHEHRRAVHAEERERQTRAQGGDR
jgi:xylulokinase